MEGVMAKLDDLHIDESMVDTVLATDIDFGGVMRFSKELMIKGKYSGEIDATGHLIVGRGAVVKATVKASVITNYGKIVGDVIALKKFEMFNNAQLSGNLTTPELIVEAGCKYNGQCTMGETVKPQPQTVNKDKNKDNSNK